MYRVIVFRSDRLKTWAYNSGNQKHLEILKKIGIELEIHSDGRMQLTHTGAGTVSISLGYNGILKFFKNSKFPPPPYPLYYLSANLSAEPTISPLCVFVLLCCRRE